MSGREIDRLATGFGGGVYGRAGALDIDDEEKLLLPNPDVTGRGLAGAACAGAADGTVVGGVAGFDGSGRTGAGLATATVVTVSIVPEVAFLACSDEPATADAVVESFAGAAGETDAGSGPFVDAPIGSDVAPAGAAARVGAVGLAAVVVVMAVGCRDGSA